MFICPTYPGCVYTRRSASVVLERPSIAPGRKDGRGHACQRNNVTRREGFAGICMARRDQAIVPPGYRGGTDAVCFCPVRRGGGVEKGGVANLRQEFWRGRRCTAGGEHVTVGRLARLGSEVEVREADHPRAIHECFADHLHAVIPALSFSLFPSPLPSSATPRLLLPQRSSAAWRRLMGTAALVQQQCRTTRPVANRCDRWRGTAAAS